MRFSIANRGGVCSTLIVTGLINQYTDDVYERSNSESPMSERVLRTMIRDLKGEIKSADKLSYTDAYYDHRGSVTRRHRLDSYKVKDFALFFSTIYAERPAKKYDETVKILRKLGFTVDTSEAVFNSKNSTYVWPVYAPVHRILEELEKYDDQGKLIVDAKTGKSKVKKTVRVKKAA